ncbi:uncharacterized protein EDB93DRAFT_444577 [Suillus bovinus]|uniref:uncharacterized protein n=1 Tax=Suillus bovinus TaxID=48563 RepID=UPI001B85BB31|nr:uncharacterized protein EDB93DRAFT_444577 [Suillus bovinus]KAG2159103.1 hypothetical protein EDB93DRAFT_444577 [Suillus bovinus]
MDPSDSFPEPGFVCYTSAHQSAGSRGSFLPIDDSDYLVTVPFESRNRSVAAGFVRPPPHILHAPQSSRPLVYPWTGSTYLDIHWVNNQTAGMSILRPPAPAPIRQMQDDLLENFHEISDNLPLHPQRVTSRFEPYHNDRSHNYHGAFLCRWDNEGTLCGDELQATPKIILAHLRQNHGIGIGNKETYGCLWKTAHGCCGDQLRFQSFGRHIIKHTGIRFKCSLCDTIMPARNDSIPRHRHSHPNCSQAEFIIIPGLDSQTSF